MPPARTALFLIAPLVFSVGYLVFSYLLFLYGPLEWDVSNTQRMSIYLGIYLLAIIAGFLLGLRRAGPAGEAALPAWRKVFRIGGIAGILLLFPSTVLYTGKWPWQVFDFIHCQSMAYIEYQTTIAENNPWRKVISLLRAVSAPLVFAVLPLGMCYWRELTWPDRLLWVLNLLALLTFSFMRGTDKETFDLTIMFMALFLIFVTRQTVLHRKPLIRLQTLAALIGLIVLIVGLSQLFAMRKADRLTNYCGQCECPSSVARSNLKIITKRAPVRKHASEIEQTKQAPINSERSSQRLNDANTQLGALDEKGFDYSAVAAEKADSAFTTATLYLTQGYYGLSLALEAPFTSTYGIGHIPFLLGKASYILGPEFEKRAYTEKISEAGWNAHEQWVTIFPWIANDVGFSGAAIVVLLFGLFWGITWRAAAVGGDNIALMLFIMQMQAVAFIPANNQLAISPDSYFTFIFWALVFIVIRLSQRRRTRASTP